MINLYLNPYKWVYENYIYNLEIPVPGLKEDTYLDLCGVIILNEPKADTDE